MIKLRKIEDIKELKIGMTILSYGIQDGHEYLEKIDCIDNGKIHSLRVRDGHHSGAIEYNNEYLEKYETYEVIYDEKNK